MFWNWFTGRKKAGQSPNRRQARPQLETLEDRTVPNGAPLSNTLIGLTSTNRIVMFNAATPGTFINNVPVIGLDTFNGEDLESIDTRPANGLIYGLTNFNNLYTINPYSGVATLVTASDPAFGINGSQVGIDFNPTVDRLRVVTNNDQNFRINPNDGSIVDSVMGGAVDPDGSLVYAMGDINEGKNAKVTAVAYTNNFQGATTTTLFAIDTNRNTLVTIIPPNNGVLNTVGKLGVDAGARVGFDIAPNGTAYASLVVNGVSRLYTVDLVEGDVTSLGKIRNGTQFKLDALTVLQREEIVFATTSDNKLVRFRANAPELILNSIDLTGLNTMTGETITGIDFRPATGLLYGSTSDQRVVIINTTTGAVTELTLLDEGTEFDTDFPTGIDFNPTTADRVRLVNTVEENIRIAVDAMPPTVTVDTDLAPDSNIVGIAYDRNDNDNSAMTPTKTTLWAIDSTTDTLVTIGGADGTPFPNLGAVTALTGEGLGALGVDTSDQVGFDIIDAGFGGSGVALAVMQLESESFSRLFTINLNPSVTGASDQDQGKATLVGTVGGGLLLTGMAIAPPTIQFSSATYSVTEPKSTTTPGKAIITLTRTGGTGSTATVEFTAQDGTASNGSDYTAIFNLVVTFLPGESQKTVEISINRNGGAEPTFETVNLSIANPTGGTTQLGAQNTAVLNIKNRTS